MQEGQISNPESSDFGSLTQPVYRIPVRVEGLLRAIENGGRELCIRTFPEVSASVSGRMHVVISGESWKRELDLAPWKGGLLAASSQASFAEVCDSGLGIVVPLSDSETDQDSIQVVVMGDFEEPLWVEAKSWKGIREQIVPDAQGNSGLEFRQLPDAQGNSGLEFRQIPDGEEQIRLSGFYGYCLVDLSDMDPAHHQGGDQEEPLPVTWSFQPGLAHLKTAVGMHQLGLIPAEEDPGRGIQSMLASGRVAVLKEYLKGQNRGLPLGQMAGEQVEHQLHRHFTGLNLDQLIQVLRRRYPCYLSYQGAPLTQAEKPDKEIPAGGATGPFQIRLDGLKLLESYQADQGAFWESLALPSKDKHALETAIREVEGHPRALGNLVMAESYFQCASGSPERAEDGLQSFLKGEAIPEPDLIRTPVYQKPVRQQVVLVFDPQKANATAWTPEGTPRSLLQPVLNGWLADLWPAPEKIMVHVRLLPPGKSRKGVQPSKWIPISALGGEPLDWLFWLGRFPDEGKRSFFYKRLEFYLYRSGLAERDTRVKVDLFSGKVPDGGYSIGEMIAWAQPSLKFLLVAGSGRDRQAAGMQKRPDAGSGLDMQAAGMQKRPDAGSGLDMQAGGVQKRSGVGSGLDMQAAGMQKRPGAGSGQDMQAGGVQKRSGAGSGLDMQQTGMQIKSGADPVQVRKFLDRVRGDFEKLEQGIEQLEAALASRDGKRTAKRGNSGIEAAGIALEDAMLSWIYYQIRQGIPAVSHHRSESWWGGLQYRARKIKAIWQSRSEGKQGLLEEGPDGMESLQLLSQLKSFFAEEILFADHIQFAAQALTFPVRKDWKARKWLLGASRIRPQLRHFQEYRQLQEAFFPGGRRLLQIRASEDPDADRIMLDLPDDFDSERPLSGLILDDWVEPKPLEGEGHLGFEWQEQRPEVPAALLVHEADLPGEALAPAFLKALDQLASAPAGEKMPRLQAQLLSRAFRAGRRGSPLRLTYELEQKLAHRLVPGLGLSPYIQLNRNIPLECLVGQERLPLDHGLRLELGLIFTQILSLKFGGEERKVEAVVEELLQADEPVNVRPAGPRSEQSRSHPRLWRFKMAISRRKLLDGGKLFLYLRQNLFHKVSDLLASSVPEADAAGKLFLEEIKALFPHFDEPGKKSWSESHLHYQFMLSFPDDKDKKRYLRPDRFSGGRLEWYHFEEESNEFAVPYMLRRGNSNQDLIRKSTITGVPDVVAETELHKLGNMLPVFQEASPGPGKPSWFAVPVALPFYSLSQVRPLRLLDSFDQEFELSAGAEADLAGLFKIKNLKSGRVREGLLWLPGTDPFQKSEVIEKVVLKRDRVYDHTWGIELLTPDGMGSGRAYYAQPDDNPYTSGVIAPESMSPRNHQEGERWTYDILTTIPENWFPFVPLHTGQSRRQVRLQGSALPRIWSDGQVTRFQPQGRLLGEPGSFMIFEEEVNEEGLLITLRWYRGFGAGGNEVLWVAREKHPISFQGAVPIEFDTISLSLPDQET